MYVTVYPKTARTTPWHAPHFPLSPCSCSSSSRWMSMRPFTSAAGVLTRFRRFSSRVRSSGMICGREPAGPTFPVPLLSVFGPVDWPRSSQLRNSRSEIDPVQRRQPGVVGRFLELENRPCSARTGR